MLSGNNYRVVAISSDKLEVDDGSTPVVRAGARLTRRNRVVAAGTVSHRQAGKWFDFKPQPGLAQAAVLVYARDQAEKPETEINKAM